MAIDSHLKSKGDSAKELLDFLTQARAELLHSADSPPLKRVGFSGAPGSGKSTLGALLLGPGAFLPDDDSIHNTAVVIEMIDTNRDDISLLVTVNFMDISE